MSHSPDKSKAASSSAETLDPEADVSGYLLQLQNALQPLTRNAALLPNHGDLAFHKSIDRKLSTKLDAEADKILDSISDVADWISKHPQGKLKYKPQDLTADGFARSLGDLVDHLLENADVCLDEYPGKVAPRRKKTATCAAKGDQDPTKPLPKLGPLPARILNVPMKPPQKKFTTKPDNRPGVPWSRPLKLGKPHAKIALGEKAPVEQAQSNLVRGVRRGMYCAEGDPTDNPYHHEIMTAQPPAFCYEEADPIAPPPIDPEHPDGSTAEIPFVWVDTAEKLRELAAHLKEDRVKEIAIDLEHHSYRTYQGIVSLMQLSTRWGDWIVDTISDEIRENSEMLNESFADPNKVKVLHGANHDVLWLQRDLGLYLVNLFDTYHATNILLFPAHGLNYLMARYCDFDADKRFQLADWRIRPLPKEMLYYARNDTHSLIYIFDSLRKELMEQGGPNAIKEVFELSKSVATAVYAKEEWDSEGEGREGWRTLWRKWGHTAAIDTEKRIKLEDMHKEERLVRRLHLWRDMVAREEDESPRYILGNATLMMIASRAPTTAAGIVSCIAMNAVPALRKRSGELAEVVKKELDAWEKASKKKEEEQKKALQDNAMDESADDVGEALTRGQEAAPTRTTPSDGVNLALWASTPAPAQASLFGGSVRSLATSLFGPRTPAPATTPTPPSKKANGLFANVSRLFGAKAQPERPSLFSSAPKMDDGKLAEIKKQLAADVGSVLRGTSTVTLAESALPEPENIAFVPKEERMPAQPVNQASTAVVQAEDGLGSSDDEPTIVPVKKKAKAKKRKRAATDEASPKKSKSSDSVDASPKKPKKKTDESFDFTNTSSVLDSPAPSKTKKKQDKPKEREDKMFIQPKKRNEIKAGSRSGTFAR